MKSPHTTLLVATVGLALLSTSAAFAGKDGKDADSHFAKMDSNGDGKISHAEHAAACQEMFVQCDSDHDGKVTATEMDTGMKGMDDHGGKHGKKSAETIQMMDQDNDGQLTASEHAAGSDKMFSKMDADSDGFLSKDEFASGMKMKKKDH